MNGNNSPSSIEGTGPIPVALKKNIKMNMIIGKKLPSITTSGFVCELNDVQPTGNLIKP